jgi:Fe-S cluster assembly protein SufD
MTIETPVLLGSGIWPSAEVLEEVIRQKSDEPGLRSDLRRNAWQAYQHLPEPTISEELWRRSSLQKIDEQAFVIGKRITKSREAGKTRSHRALSQKSALGGQLVIEDGKLSAAYLDHTSQQDGVILSPFTKENVSQARPWLGKIISAESGRFEALGAMLSGADSFVYIPKGIHVANPLQTQFRESQTGASAGRLLIVVDEGASLSLLHEQSLIGARMSAVRMQLIEIVVRKGGTLRFGQIQTAPGKVWEYTHAHAVLEEGASLEWQYANVGAASGRTVLEMDLAGEGATGRLAGLYTAAQEQQVECVTLQRHAAPHTTSDFLYKGVAMGSARSVWRGMVRVEENAIGADGYQANRNLVLSEEARVESLPGLEILADDIRCSHGATVGTLDPDEVFYLLTRGVPEVEVRRVLMAGFIEPVISRFPTEGVRKRLRLAVGGKMKTIKKGGEPSLPRIKGGIPGLSGKSI